MYVCGVTVYDLCHIGHARSCHCFRRAGEIPCGQEGSTSPMSGILRTWTTRSSIGPGSLGKEPKALAEEYIEAFYDDMGKLGMLNADQEPRATEHIQGMIDMIVTLIDKGFAYVEGNGCLLLSGKILRIRRALRQAPGGHEGRQQDCRG